MAIDGGFCWELVDGRERTGAVLDLSSGGLLLERPFVGGATPARVQLELEVPGTDEIIWASAHVRFDRVTRGTTPGGGLLRRTGLALATMARRDASMLRDWAHEQRHRAAILAGEAFDFGLASNFARG